MTNGIYQDRIFPVPQTWVKEGRALLIQGDEFGILVHKSDNLLADAIKIFQSLG